MCGIIYSSSNSLISIFLYFHLFETYFFYLIAVAVLVLSSVVIVFTVALEVTIQYFLKFFLFLQLRLLLNNHYNNFIVAYSVFFNLDIYLPGQEQCIMVHKLAGGGGEVSPALF